VTEMSTVITALVMIAMMLTTGLAIAQSSLTSVDYMAQCWKETESAAQETSRTDISVLNAQTAGGFAEVLVYNSGSVHIAQFPRWDVLVHYYDDYGDYHIVEAEYVEGTIPGDNQWCVAGIYTDDTLGQVEVFEPGILNPGEVMLLRVNLVPLPCHKTMCWVTVSTPGGVKASVQFEV
jgi:hypothetical protein